MNGLLGQRPAVNGLLDIPVTANRNMLAQAVKARNKPEFQMKENTLQGILDGAAMATSPVPILGDLLGLGADGYRFATDPTSRNMLNYGLAALGALPMIPAMSMGLGKLAQSQGKTLGQLPTGPGRNQAGAIVYHGSPHKFDAFDSSKIGTGEGAQAYGHGLYFAESPDVAKSYQTALAGTTVPDIEGMASKIGIPKISADTRVEIMRQAKDGVPSDVAAKRLTYASTELRNQPVEKLQSLIDQYREAKNFGGSLYKVDLPDEAIAKMLDWDKPLSQQSPEVQALLRNAGINPEQLLMSSGKDIVKGSDSLLFKDFIKRSGHKNMEGLLNQSGIPGIRYLDGGSRDAGQGTSNYVVFPGNEGLLKILGRE